MLENIPRKSFERFRKFETEINPLIKSYVPPDNRSSNHYLEMNLKDELERFPGIRAEMV